MSLEPPSAWTRTCPRCTSSNTICINGIKRLFRFLILVLQVAFLRLKVISKPASEDTFLIKGDCFRAVTFI